MGNLPEGWTDEKISSQECFQRGHHFFYLKGCFAECGWCGENVRAYGRCSICGNIRFDPCGCEYGC